MSGGPGVFWVPNGTGGFNYVYGAPFQPYIGGVGGGAGGANMQVAVLPGGAPPGTGAVGGGAAGVPGDASNTAGGGTGTGGGTGGGTQDGNVTDGNTRVDDSQEVIDSDDGEEEEEQEETNQNKMIASVAELLKELREENAKARKEDKERQDKLEERIERAEANKAPPPGDDRRDGDRRGDDRRDGDRRGDRRMDNRGAVTGDEGKKGQCRNQLLGKQCDARRCQYIHKALCKAYKENGRKGCWDGICRLLHPYDCKSVEEGWICDNKLCHAWHDRWEFKEHGTPINPYGAWNGGSFQTPPKGFEKAPGIKEKGEKKNEKEESNKDESSGGEGNLKGPWSNGAPPSRRKWT